MTRIMTTYIYLYPLQIKIIIVKERTKKEEKTNSKNSLSNTITKQTPVTHTILTNVSHIVPL